MAKVFRVEKPNSDQGLWYTKQGVLQPIVHGLGLSCSTLPMDFDEGYSRDGIAWYSGCSEMSDLVKWFNPKELLLLKTQGFELFEFESEFVRDYAGHQVFSKQHLLSSSSYDISKLL